ncbi:MAG: Nif3-like dinuclear metal center hexameric protein [Acidobacteriota bacterium]
MTIAEFQQEFERTTPPGAAWKNDNIGLLIGRHDAEIANILVALDVTMEVAREAVRKKANLIVAHHPVIFQPLKAVTSQTAAGRLALYLIEHGVAVYAAHTNFDSVKTGVSFALAACLELSDVSVLSPQRDSLAKIAVFVPPSHAEAVAEAMHGKGAGMFTKYDECSFRTDGIGTFRGMADAQPFIGRVGELERTQEVRIEMLAERWKIDSVVRAMIEAHPYEEVAYDVYPLENRNTEYGLGAVGTLRVPVRGSQFLKRVRRLLHCEGIRYAGSAERMISRVAVCGGSGSDLIADARRAGADAFVTADLKYHTMQDAAEHLLIVDAGHYETERIALGPLSDQLRSIGGRAGARHRIFVTQITTNPIHFC